MSNVPHRSPNGIYIAPDVLRLDPTFPRARRRRRLHPMFAPLPPWPVRLLAAIFAHLRRSL